MIVPRIVHLVRTLSLRVFSMCAFSMCALSFGGFATSVHGDVGESSKVTREMSAIAKASSLRRESPMGQYQSSFILAQADEPLQLPSWSTWKRVLLLRDYNTRVVTLGTVLLGVTSGCVGVFVLLRKRSLVGDVVGHASLPGIAIAFIVMEAISPGEGRSLPALLFGATVAGMTGVLAMTVILRYTRVKEDAALAIVLSVFFGFGMVLFTIIQNMPAGHSAGLSKFIFGTAASMIASDVWLIAQAAVVVLVCCSLLFKEFGLLCFDESFASAQGWPTGLLDLVLMGLVVAVAEIGAQSVGLILVVALMIIPASAARFWTDDLKRMAIAASVFGGASAYIGVLVSALMPKLAAGATIVIVGGMFFAASMMFGATRGVVWRLLARRRLRYRVGRHDLMRTFYELLERDESSGEIVGGKGRFVTVGELLSMRAWSNRRLQRVLRQAERDGLVVSDLAHGYRLTKLGLAESHRAARNHRMWELYLIQYADIAPSHVDRDADQIEHILAPEIVFELELLMEQTHPNLYVPPSPHDIKLPSNPATT